MFEEKSANGKSGFEVLISWKDIEPYHPWFLKDMGYNLYFAKAIGDTITNGYAVVADEGIWDEELPKRNFVPIEFEKPGFIEEEFIGINLQRRNVKEQESLVMEIVTMSNKSTSKIVNVSLFDDKGEMFYTEEINIQLNKKLALNEVELNTGTLNSAKYKLIVSSSNDTLSNIEIVVFPKIDFDLIYSKLEENQNQLTIGIVNTLTFKLKQLQEKIRDLKSYESGALLLDDINVFYQAYASFNKGLDPYEGILEPYRRAFKSKYDDTYQPYSIRLPKNYDPNKKYPLLVFLHGSGQDEQTILKSPRSNGDFIEIAPLARDIYYCYSSDYAQKDIIEAIDDVLMHFSVDENKMIIGGFSMGGYGALRTFYEHPELYKGVAVFAGHPRLASEWLDGEHPDFLKDKYLSSLSGMPVFIYHGTKDGALPVHLIEEMSLKLQSAGAEITKNIVEGRGHQYPDEETNVMYFDWLDAVINN